jgi:carbon monoxide dehydrogenase subunit G
VRTASFCWTVAALVAATIGAAAASGPEPVVSVRERGGEYVVAASFSVAAPAAAVRGVLTDYANIPRFMPGVEKSRVLGRTEGLVHVEQEATSKYMMFSKRVHLLLEVEEAADAIRFRDRCNRSFARYEGAWTITGREGATDVAYALTAKPAFGVPAFVIRRLLQRDARAMIDGLRLEIASRTPGL